MYSDRLFEIINLIGPNLRRIDFLPPSADVDFVHSQNHDPSRLRLDQSLKLVVPMPFLQALTIGQMCSELEPAIINLVKNSDCHPVKICLLDPGDSWIGSDEFMEFLIESKDGLDLEVGLPSVNQEKGEMGGEDMMDQEDVMELWVFLLKWYLSALGLILSIFYLYTNVYSTM
jgi:hypothetical protein